LQKISIASVGCTNVTDRGQTDRLAGNDIIIANVNVSSRSLKKQVKIDSDEHCGPIWR